MVLKNLRVLRRLKRREGNKMTNSETEARKIMRDIQNKYGKFITPEISAKIGNAWNNIIEKDGNYSGALELAETLKIGFESGKYFKTK